MSSTTVPTPDLTPAVKHVLKSRNPTQELMSELRGMAIDQPKLVKATRQQVHPPRAGAPAPPADDPPAPEYITSWKMLEHLYRQSPCPFPTLSRGLFTTWTSEKGVPEPGVKGEGKGKSRERVKEEEGGEWRIVARGYDKFFNVGEVGWTEVSTC
jgi:tRNA ligase